MPFEITSPSIIHGGAGAFAKVAGEAARLGTRAVIVTGSHLYGSHRIARLVDELKAAGVEAVVAEPVTSEPTVEMVDQLAAFLCPPTSTLSSPTSILCPPILSSPTSILSLSKDAAHNSGIVVVAIGGGSVMDAAKAAALMATNEGITEDYQLQRREITNPPLAQLFVPTTAGTGSEATRVSVLTNNAAGVKRSVSHPLMTPNVVILDPELTITCDTYLTTITAMDAFSHAIESAVSTKSSAFTRHVALAAIEELSAGLPACQSDPGNLDARLACLTGACFAGLAMQQGMGASHCLSPAISIVSGIRHSEAVAALLPHSIRLNMRTAASAYDGVRRAMGSEDPASTLEQLCTAGGFECNLSQFGLKQSDWDQIREVMARYAGHRLTNPVEITDAYAEELFAKATETRE